MLGLSCLAKMGISLTEEHITCNWTEMHFDADLEKYGPNHVS